MGWEGAGVSGVYWSYGFSPLFVAIEVYWASPQLLEVSLSMWLFAWIKPARLVSFNKYFLRINSESGTGDSTMIKKCPVLFLRKLTC